jgi:hypothetical protein
MTFHFSYLKDDTTSWLLFAYSGNNEPIVHRTSYSELDTEMSNQIIWKWIKMIIKNNNKRINIYSRIKRLKLYTNILYMVTINNS